MSPTSTVGVLVSVAAFVVLSGVTPVLCRKVPAPGNFGPIAATTSSITLSWEPPPLEPGEKLKGYRLNYRASTEKKEKKINLPKSANSHTVEDLAEGTLYVFAVFAKSQDGTGRASERIEVATESSGPELQPPGVPQYFEVLVISDSIYARWQQPEGDDFAGYVLAIAPITQPDSEVVTNLEPTVESHTFDSLEPGTEYVLTIRAFNDAGQSQTASRTAYIEQQTPPAPQAFSVNPSVYSIEASWASAEENVRNFIVGIGIDELEENTVELNWDETNYVFEDLDPDTLYLISVRAVNENGPGEAATEKVRTEDVREPPAPIIESVEAEPNSLTIRWRASPGLVTGYEISLDPFGTVTVGADETSYTFTGLSADTDYVLRLKAANEVGMSPPSEQLVTTEPLGPPAAPIISMVDVTSSSITVTWKSTDPNVGSFYVSLDGVGGRQLLSPADTYIFTSLAPDRTYTVELRARSPGGDSPVVTQTVTTEPVAILPAPVIESDDATTDSITISWRPTVEPVISYQISIDGGSPITVGPGETSYTFTGLEPGTEHLIALSVTNLGGESPPTTERVATESLSPLQRPTIMSAEATTDTIAIRWERPSEPIMRYELTLVGNDPIVLGAQETSYTFSNLEPDTRYTVELRVVNEGGPSNPARSRVVTEPLPQPEVPEIEPPTDGAYRVRNFDADVQGQTVILSWEPPTDFEDDTLLGYLLEIEAEAISLDTSLRLHYRQRSYTFRNLEPLVEFHAVLTPIRRELRVDPSDVTFTTYVSRFVPPRIQLVEILSSSAARVVWMDPTIPPNRGITDSRYYTLRYRPLQGSSNYLYANTREFEYSVGDLIPDTEYEFSVQTILEGVTSGYSEAVRNSTLSETDGQAPRLLTVVQLTLEFPNYIHATLNWLPPLERADEVSGYNVQYSDRDNPGPLDWKNLPIEGRVMSATIPKLTTNMTASFRIQAFFFSGNPLGPFAPPVSFVTPISAQQGVEEGNCATELEFVTQRITSTRERGGGVPPLGVPLPFCDEYLSQYACPWPTLVCTCIPRGTNVMAAVPSAKPNPGCDAISQAPPCRKVYERVMDAINQSRKTGILLMGANLPYCREDGYFESKQCAGSVCYCVNDAGIPDGREGPVWDAANLDCR